MQNYAMKFKRLAKRFKTPIEALCYDAQWLYFFPNGLFSFQRE